MAAAHGIKVDLDRLLHGLPLKGGELDAIALQRSAARAGLACRLVAVPLARLDPRLFPVILLTKQNGACVLHRLTQEGGQVSYPALSDAVEEVPLDKLAADYRGRAIYLRPLVKLDAHSDEIHKKRLGHWFWSVIGDYKKLYRDIFLAAVLINLFALATPLFMRIVYNKVIPNGAMATFWVLASGLLVVFLFDLTVRLLQVVFIDRVAALVDTRVSARLMEQVLGMRMEARPKSTGAFATNLYSFEQLRAFITSASLVSLINLPFALLFLAVVTLISPLLAVPLAVGAVLILIHGWLLQGKLRRLTETSYRAGAQRNAMLVESLHGLETLKSLGAEGRVQGEWERLVAFLARIGTQIRFWTASLSNGALWMQNMSLLVLVAVGVHLIQLQAVTVGGLIAAYMLGSRALAPISQAAGLMVQYHHAHTALAALEQVMNLPQEIAGGEESLVQEGCALRGGLRLEGVSFQYPETERDVLHQLFLKAEPGERIAVLGRSGSGKTTLARLLMAHYRPTSGRIFFDGVDQGALPPPQLRRQIGYVAQEPILFRGSLHYNLTLGLGGVDPDAFQRAVEITGLDEWVSRHPHGYRLEVGEGGKNLSGGQRQAVALTRIVLQDPRMLVLDEPTGAMDQSSEARFLRRFREWVEGRTLVLITHRSALLDLVERVVVLEGGRIVADGPRLEVLDALRKGRIVQIPRGRSHA